MKQYNVEIFDRNMNYVTNTCVSDIKYKSDYLDPEKWTVELIDVDMSIIEQNYFIRVMNDEEKYIGIIVSKEEKQEGVIRLSIAEIPSLFDIDLMIDVKDFGYSFEGYIEKWLKALFIEGDSSMTMPFEISVSSETLNWSIEYQVKNEVDDPEKEQPPILVAFVNLFDDIILPAFTAHQIRLDYDIDLRTKKIRIDIGKNENPTINIESDLPNIIDKSIVIRKNTNEVNKIIVFNKEDYRESLTYYLHSDETFDTNDVDRLLPVSYKLLEAEKETEKIDDEEVVTKTFEEAAYEKAFETFSKNKYTNLIKLEMPYDDDLIHPMRLKIGQIVKITSDNVVYDSILTGVEVDQTATLIFGTVRLELTKILKGRG